MKKILLTVCAIFICIFTLQAQETKEIKNNQDEKLLVKIKDGAEPDIYVDGKKFDFALELLDQSKIESISVFKGEQAIEKYNAPNGAIIITTKKTGSHEIKIRGNAQDKGKAPMIIINGKVANKDALEKLSPDAVDNVNIVKGEQALEKHNAPNGVIIVTTKKVKN